jgi:hypothetical protein
MKLKQNDGVDYGKQKTRAFVWVKIRLGVPVTA